MNLTAHNAAIEYVSGAIAAGGDEADIAREVERLCGESNVEYHPLVCDAVVAGFPDENDKQRHCDHVSNAARLSAEAKLKAAQATD